MHEAAATKPISSLSLEHLPQFFETYRITKPLTQHALGEDQDLSQPFQEVAILEQSRAAKQTCTIVLYPSHIGIHQCGNYL